MRRRGEFRATYATGMRVNGRLVVLFARERHVTGMVRLGITASRKVGDAVVRNRVKRRLREVFRVRFPDRWTGGLDLVVNATRGCARASWQELTDDFDRCVVRLERRLGAPATTRSGRDQADSAPVTRGGE